MSSSCSAGPLAVVCGAIVHDGRLLAVQRGPGGAAAHKWELPGGKVEPGEQPAAALARELDEELGLTVVVGEQTGVAQHRYPSLWLELRCLVCRLEPGDQRPVLREHVDHRWLDRSTLHSVDWAEADLPLLGAVAERLVAGA